MAHFLSSGPLSWARVCLAAGALFGGAARVRSAPPELFRDPKAPAEQRVDDLLRRLTLEEKTKLCFGNITPTAEGRFQSGGIARLGIKPISFRDGPLGLRAFDATHATAMPCTLALACTWDLSAAHDYGRLLAEEFQAVGAQVLFGPGLDLMRDPRGGRNFEYLGEDPFLAGSMGVSYIHGAQELGIAACAKHLVANDYETHRHFTSSNLDERTLREMHLLPFEMAIREGGVWSMMTGNNLLDGTHAAANRPLLQDLVKDQLGFDGVMMTDWRAAYDTVPTALAGTDMTTGFCAYVFGEGRLLNAVRSGQVPLALLDDKARRILRLYARTGLLDPTHASAGALDTAGHRALARRLASEGMVLLKNDRHLLPLDFSKAQTLLVTGPGAQVVRFGRGSGEVHSAFHTTPLAGLRAEAGPQMKIDYEEGSAKAQKAAPTADAVIFFATCATHGEGTDLPDLELPDAQAQRIEALAAVNPDVVVVLQTGGPVSLEPFADHVPAILATWYAGEAAGDAIADVLSGATNPAGKLACTFGRRLEDYPCEALGLWPPRQILKRATWNARMTPEDRRPVYGFAADYKEGVFIGYRWFDEKKIEPRFPFGHGLSYTTFDWSGLAVDDSGPTIRLSCVVKNSGLRPGSEVLQAYVAPPLSSVPRPPEELKGFARVSLEPGQSQRIDLVLPRGALAYYDVVSKKWKADAGTYEIRVGASSRDIRLRAHLTLATDLFVDRFPAAN